MDDEKGRRWLYWLTIAMVFSFAFSGLFFYVTFTYVVELWIFVSALVLLLFALVCIYAMLHIKSRPSTGVFFKRFKLRPATVVTLLERAARSSRIQLREVPVMTTRWDLRRDWDTCRSYEIVGRESHVNIVRRFRIFYFWVHQYTYVEMGPKGIGEDEFLDEFASAIDAANLMGEEPTRVDFSEARGEYTKGTALMVVFQIIWAITVVQILGERMGYYVEGVSGPLPFNTTTQLMILVVMFIMLFRAQGLILAAARKVTAPGNMDTTSGPS